jgi:hypothetical protein
MVVQVKMVSVLTTFGCLYVTDVSEVAHLYISLVVRNTRLLRSALLMTGLLIPTEFFFDQPAWMFFLQKFLYFLHLNHCSALFFLILTSSTYSL